MDVILFSHAILHILFEVMLPEYYRRKFNCRRNGLISTGDKYMKGRKKGKMSKYEGVIALPTE